MDYPDQIQGNRLTWNYSGGRSITIESEPAPGLGFQRPIRVTGGVIIVQYPPGRDRSLLPLAIQDEELWGNYKENSFEGGHIIGLALGGPDHSYNIAPMSKGANCGSGTWGVLEQELRTRIKNAGAAAVAIDLTLSYNDSVDPHVPSRVKGSIGGISCVNAELRPPSDRTNIIGTELKQLFRSIQQEAEQSGIFSTSESPHAPLDIVDRNGPVSQGFRNRIRRIPILAKYPSGGIKKKSQKGKASTEQRLLMMLYNRFRNGGLLMAEDPDNLGFILNEWRVQADHIRPYSKSGNRQYRNFRLLHHRTNNRRGAGGIATGGRHVRVRKAPLRFGRDY